MGGFLEGLSKGLPIGVDKKPQVSNLFVSPLGADRPCDTDLFVCPKNSEELYHYFVCPKNTEELLKYAY